METREIVVGSDGSACATGAVIWAAEEAALRGAPLRILLSPDAEWPTEGVRRVEVRTQRVVGPAVPALLDAAQGAAMLVVGGHGRGPFTSLLLGSVSQRVASRAPCAVAVVRDVGEAGPVVVGTDGSDAARRAVGLGFQLAAERHAPLLAVRAYYPPSPPLGFGYGALMFALDNQDSTVEQELRGDLNPWREKYPQVDVRIETAHGSAAGALVARSGHARAVVVGSRGRSAVTGTLLGSVGLQVMHYANCPVVVTHDGPR